MNYVSTWTGYVYNKLWGASSQPEAPSKSSKSEDLGSDKTYEIVPAPVVKAPAKPDPSIEMRETATKQHEGRKQLAQALYANPNKGIADELKMKLAVKAYSKTGLLKPPSAAAIEAQELAQVVSNKLGKS